MKIETLEIEGKRYLAIEIHHVQERENGKPERLEHIKRVVALRTGITNINHATRKREVVRARQICHFFGWLMYNGEGNEKRLYNVFSLTEIGRYMGYKDHGTVLHSVKVIKNGFIYKNEVEQLREIAKDLECTELFEKYLSEA